MLCFLFRVPFANGSGGFHIRPVSWEDPAQLLTPMWAKQTPDALAWLEAHGNPEWNSGFNSKKNCLSLKARLGYWPEPVDVPVTLTPQEFNDPIPF